MENVPGKNWEDSRRKSVPRVTGCEAGTRVLVANKLTEGSECATDTGSFTLGPFSANLENSFFFWATAPPPQWAKAPSFIRFLDHTQRRITVGRIPLYEWSARRTDLYLTTHNTHNRKTSMPPMGFEPTISAGDRPKTYALDHATSGTGNFEDWRQEITGHIATCHVESWILPLSELTKFILFFLDRTFL